MFRSKNGMIAMMATVGLLFMGHLSHIVDGQAVISAKENTITTEAIEEFKENKHALPLIDSTDPNRYPNRKVRSRKSN